jgi:alpha-ketoglutarate-dependent taurine dioxygenase
MRPYNAVAEQTLPELVLTLDEEFAKNRIEIQWEVHQKILVFDNWRILHSRGAVNNSAGRELERVFVS